MLIRYYGHSYFLIIGNDYSIALDPFGDIGLPQKNVTADYLFISHGHYDHNNADIVNGADIITRSGGAFEIINSYHDEVKGKKRGINNVLKFILDGKTFVFMGDIGLVDDTVVEKCKNCDYLLIPVGGTYTIDKNGAKTYIEKIKPSFVIPMHYHINGSTVDIDSVSNFCKLFDDVVYKNSPYNIGTAENKIIVINPEI